MCDAKYLDTSTPVVRRPLVPGVESKGKCLKKGASEAFRCVERSRDGKFFTHCDNVCAAEAQAGSYRICRKALASSRKDEKYNEIDVQPNEGDPLKRIKTETTKVKDEPSDGSRSPTPSKRRKQDGGSSGGSPSKPKSFENLQDQPILTVYDEVTGHVIAINVQEMSCWFEVRSQPPSEVLGHV